MLIISKLSLRLYKELKLRERAEVFNFFAVNAFRASDDFFNNRIVEQRYQDFVERVQALRYPSTVAGLVVLSGTSGGQWGPAGQIIRDLFPTDPGLRGLTHRPLHTIIHRPRSLVAANPLKTTC